MFKLNLKIALRNLWRNKGFTLINLGGLAIGLASCMVLLLYVAYEWGFDKQFSNYDKTYVVYNNEKTETEIVSFDSAPKLMADEIRAKVVGVANASKTSYPKEKLVSYNQNSFQNNCIYVDEYFLNIFDYKVLKGNKDKFFKDPNTIVITETLAKKLFGNEDPISKVIKFDNAIDLKVEGVIQDVPQNASMQFDFLLPWSLYENLDSWVRDTEWDSSSFKTFVQLQDNSFLDKTNAQIRGMIKSHTNVKDDPESFLHPLAKWHLYEKFENGKNVGGKIDQLKIFFILAFCILLIACINFMNLSTARSEKRAKEVGVRKAIGSSRKSLISQFMLESLLLTGLGVLLAFMLIEVSLPYFNNLLNISLKINYIDWKFWTVFLGLAIFTGFIAGSYPAFYLSSFDPIKVLKGFGKAGGSSLSVRKVLVVFQFVFAACLIVCTTVIFQQLNYIKNKPIGYDKNNLVQLRVQGNLINPGKRQVVIDEIIKSGAATSATESSLYLTSEGNIADVSLSGKSDEVRTNFRTTTFDFVKTTGMELVAGRDFSKQFNDSASVIVNETLIKALQIKQPLGQLINYGGLPLKIVGVIKDYVIESPYRKSLPLIVFQDKYHIGTIILRLNNQQNITSSLAQIDAIVKKFNPAYPVQYQFVDENFEKKFRNEKLLGTLSNWFGGFAIFISCLGLLGLALYMAEQRKKEISIRKVLGASTVNILNLLNKDFIKLVIIANCIAFPVAYIIITKWLSNYEYKVSISVLPFAIAASLSILIAILTVSLQSFKVAKANPVDALKYE